MPIALSDFWTKLVESGITDAEGCRRIAQAFSEANGGTPPAESISLAKYLIKSGSLTDFQARQILAGQSIRVGPFVLRADKAPPPLSRWLPVVASDGRRGVVFRAPRHLLAGGRDQWVAAHAAVETAVLQPIAIEELGQDFAIFSSLPDGRCLIELTSRGRSLDPARACQCGIAIADALDALHQRSLTHGAVRADRVWISDEGQAILLRDPSGASRKSTGRSG